jgi:hypothetical protein
MELSTYFQKITPNIIDNQEVGLISGDISANISDFPAWESADIIIIGAYFSEKGKNANESIRTQFYSLSTPTEEMKIADLGDIIPRENALAQQELMALIIGKLMKAGKLVLLLCENKKMFFSQYLAYENISERVDYVQVSPRLSLSENTELNDNSVNSYILKQDFPKVENFTNLGFLKYWVKENELNKLLETSHSQAIRCGELNEKITETEPYLRTANMISLDLSVVKHCDSPGSFSSSGGFSSSDICRIARYAGCGTAVKSISFTGLDVERDIHAQSAMLCAMMMWYCVEGFYSRREENPTSHSPHFRKYSVKLNAEIEEIIFYHSLATQRWWMEVPYPEKTKSKKAPKTILIPCSSSDYETAMAEEIPERWWRKYNQL